MHMQIRSKSGRNNESSQLQLLFINILQLCFHVYHEYCFYRVKAIYSIQIYYRRRVWVCVCVGGGGGASTPRECFCMAQLPQGFSHFMNDRFKPGSHQRHKHKHKIDTKTKHDISSGTCTYKTTRISLCFVFCSALGLCFDYVLILCLCRSICRRRHFIPLFCLLFVLMLMPLV